MLTVALLRASLPSYFPARHGVWDRAERMLGGLCAAHGARLVILPGIPQDARETRVALDVPVPRARISSCACMAGSRWAMWRA